MERAIDIADSSPSNVFPPEVLERIKTELDKYKNTHEQEQEGKTIAQVLDEIKDKITPKAARSIWDFVIHNPGYEHAVIALLHDSVNSTDAFKLRRARDLASLIVNPHSTQITLKQRLF